MISANKLKIIKFVSANKFNGMERYIILLGCLILGQLFHLFIKAAGANKRAKSAELQFSFGTFIREDIYNILGALTCAFIFLMILTEILGYAPSIEKYIRTMAVTIGYTGSSIGMYFFSNIDKKIREQIKSKNDILGSILAPERVSHVQVFDNIRSLDDQVIKVNAITQAKQVPVKLLPDYNSKYFIQDGKLYLNSQQKVRIELKSVDGEESYLIESFPSDTSI